MWEWGKKFQNNNISTIFKMLTLTKDVVVPIVVKRQVDFIH